MVWNTPDLALVTAIRKDEGLKFRPVSFILDESKALISSMKTYTSRGSKKGKRTGSSKKVAKRIASSHRTMGTRADLYQKAMKGY